MISSLVPLAAKIKHLWNRSEPPGHPKRKISISCNYQVAEFTLPYLKRARTAHNRATPLPWASKLTNSLFQAEFKDLKQDSPPARTTPQPVEQLQVTAAPQVQAGLERIWPQTSRSQHRNQLFISGQADWSKLEIFLCKKISLIDD